MKTNQNKNRKTKSKNGSENGRTQTVILFYYNQFVFFLPTGWSSANAFVSGLYRVRNAFVHIYSGAESLRFKSWAGQIRRSAANSSPTLPHFFERSCVARAQWCGDGPCKLVTCFYVIERVWGKIWCSLESFFLCGMNYLHLQYFFKL